MIFYFDFSPSKYLFSQILNSQFSSLSLGGDSNNCPKFMFSQLESSYVWLSLSHLPVYFGIPCSSGLESDAQPMCISLDSHRREGREGKGRGGEAVREGEGYTMAVYQNIY